MGTRKELKRQLRDLREEHERTRSNMFLWGFMAIALALLILNPGRLFARCAPDNCQRYTDADGISFEVCEPYAPGDIW